MSTRLVPLNAGTAPSIDLTRPVVLIGRHPDCDLQLDLPKISRLHCCLALAYDRVLIRDLGSRNGLRVNGRQVDEAQLYPGDEVAIGPLLFRMDAQAEDIPSPRPPTPPKVSVPPKPSYSTKPPARPADQNDPDGDLIPLAD